MSKREIRTYTTQLTLAYLATGGQIAKCPDRTAYGGESRQRQFRKFLRDEAQASI